MARLPTIFTLLENLEEWQFRVTCEQCGQRVLPVSSLLRTCPERTSVGDILVRLRCKEHGTKPRRVALHQAPGPGGYRICMVGDPDEDG